MGALVEQRMILWLLNHVSTLVIAVLLVGGLTGLAAAGSLAARRRFPHLAKGEHNEMVGVALGMFGAIYGIILAFVVVTLWTQLENTQNIVATEATDLALVVRSADTFPLGRPRAGASSGGRVLARRRRGAMAADARRAAELRGDRAADARPLPGPPGVRALPEPAPRPSTPKRSPTSTTSPRSAGPASRWPRAHCRSCCKCSCTAGHW